MTKSVLLCVDDEIIVLHALKDLLHTVYGHQHVIEIAESAEEGLEIIDEQVQDGCELLVIVSDWLMPGMKGDEFLIESHKRLPKVVKIMLSGHADPAAVQRAREHAKLHDFVHKPWDGATLLRSIQSGLSGEVGVPATVP